MNVLMTSLIMHEEKSRQVYVLYELMQNIAADISATVTTALYAQGWIKVVRGPSRSLLLGLPPAHLFVKTYHRRW